MTTSFPSTSVVSSFGSFTQGQVVQAVVSGSMMKIVHFRVYDTIPQDAMVVGILLNPETLKPIPNIGKATVPVSRIR